MADLPTIELKIDQIIENLGSAGQKTVAPIVDRIQRIEEAIFGGAGVGLIISSASIATIIRSTNFESGVSGWQIQKSGDVEFQNGIFRGDITADSGFFSGLVYVGDAPDRIVLDGPNKQVRSEDFDTGIEGWAINGDGTVEFQSAVLRGDITADSGRFWGTVYVGASPGFRTVIDGAAGSIHSEGYVANTSGWNINHDGSAEFRDVVIRGSIKASVFTYNETNAIAGSQFILPSAGTLRAAATVASSFNIDITDPESGHVRLFNIGDKIRIQDGAVGSTWGTVASYIDLTTFYRYTITYDSGSSPVTYQKGTVVLDYGVSGDGGILMNADGATGPFISVFTHAGSPWAATTERVRVGNLNGWGPFATDLFGLALGDYAGSNYMYFNPSTSELKFRVASTVTLALDGITIDAGTGDLSRDLKWTVPGTSDIYGKVTQANDTPTGATSIQLISQNKNGDSFPQSEVGLSALSLGAGSSNHRKAWIDMFAKRNDDAQTYIHLYTGRPDGLGNFGGIEMETTYLKFKSVVAGAEESMTLSKANSGLKLSSGGYVNEFSTDTALSGHSDSAVPTEKVVNSAIPLGVVEGRLTFTSGNAVPTSDQTAKTTIYFTPYKGNRLRLYNGTNWTIYTFTELSLSLSGFTADKNNDIFIYDNAGTLTLERVEWTNNSTRATALAVQDGVYVKSGSTTKRYLGTFRTTGTTGQSEDSASKRYCWNYYNREPRTLLVTEQTTHTHSSASWRAWNNNQANADIEFVLGVAEEQLMYVVNCQWDIASGESSPNVGAGQDTTAGNSISYSMTSNVVGTNQASIPAVWSAPAAGYHFICVIEFGAATPPDLLKCVLSTTIMG